MKIFLIFFLFIVSFLSQASSLEKGKWSFVKTDEYCYVASLAIDTDLDPDKKRGEYYILVYKNIGNPDTVVQIEAGYTYNTDEPIVVKIDKSEYIFFTTTDLPGFAWTNDDEKIIYAMKKGLKLTVTGESNRGTVTNDTYTLSGFTASYNKLKEEC